MAPILLLNAMYPLRGESPPPSNFAPFFWGPSSDEYYASFDGGVLPNLGEWLIPIIFWAITSIAWAFMCLFLIINDP